MIPLACPELGWLGAFVHGWTSAHYENSIDSTDDMLEDSLLLLKHKVSSPALAGGCIHLQHPPEGQLTPAKEGHKVEV